MKTLRQACTPRKSVHDRTRRDTVLELTDFLKGKVDPKEFFEENYMTDGMKRLLFEAFRRFSGESDQCVFMLSQAMGGGKTHNQISLGVLAREPSARKQVMGDLLQNDDLGEVRVIGFSGRDSDAPMGIWGALAEQLGKRDLFKDYYSPLQAPGPAAWINLLKGEPLLILLDELPPYFEATKSKTVGNSDLSQVTATALANLLVAVSKEELKNVCVVISDLGATSWKGGSEAISQALKSFENEVGRIAMRLEPVALHKEELYHILRKRLFETLPGDEDIWEVAKAYSQAVKDAKQMDITNASPEKFASQLHESYPFHFSIRDLYARFKENPGFQQTRGLIRLMRTVVSRMWKTKAADNRSLIHPYDIDLNDTDTRSEVLAINGKLDPAIAHDIASNGSSVAENMDANLGDGQDAQDACKLILVSSLANVPNATLGLTVSEIVSYLCVPGRDVSRLPKDILGLLATRAWYLHSNREGRLFFRDTQNLVAKLNTMADALPRESSRKELQSILGRLFEPSLKDCYQDVLALPGVDEIDVKPDRVTLVISPPHPGAGLHPDLQKFWSDLGYKNRVLFLSGERDALDALLSKSAEAKAIQVILKEMDDEKVSEKDAMRVEAQQLTDKIQGQILSAAREAFTRLYYPSFKPGSNEAALLTADFIMNFTDNNYNGEKQIREALKSKQKFTEDTTSDSFRMRFEERIFANQQVVPWNELKKRTAGNTKWPWHRPSALEELKDALVAKDQWRENDGFIDKGPFPPPKTEIAIRELHRDDDTGEVTLRLEPVHADVVHYEIGGSPATTGSPKVDNLQSFKTNEMHLSFLAVDSTGKNETGSPRSWKNKITLKYRLFQDGDDKRCELQAAPNASIKYTTNGSDPKNSGGTYDDPFVIPKGSVVVLAIAEKGDTHSDVLNIPIDWEKDDGVQLDLFKAALWKRAHDLRSTKETYEFLDRLKRHSATVPGPKITLSGERYIELTFDPKLEPDPAQIEEAIKPLRGLLSEGQVWLDVDAIRFPSGQALQDWVAEVKTEILPGEVMQ
ncbi:MAG: hypothetical protein PWP23_3146 [Candidatus Sumerlaeota bacterium]|nr:hypothetical protein [Candidatus Sumerlaeota bacterium]